MSSRVKAGCRKVDGAWIPTIWAHDLQGSRILWQAASVKFDLREDAATFAVDELMELIESGQLRIKLPK